MNKTEKRLWLINELLNERGTNLSADVPNDAEGQKRLLRSLFNLRLPAEISDGFLKVQDEYLKESLAEKGITDVEALIPLEEGICLWKGDITTLRIDAVVNAANSGMTGCYSPCHNCIDNCIHTYAGVELRLECARLMEKQGHEEPSGQAKITSAYNLPSKYVIHTVGPIVDGKVTEEHKKTLASCYTSCLRLADRKGCKSLAFCCISTGVFGFPQREAAQIAVKTVREYKKRAGSAIKVVFNVFKDEDFDYYRDILGK